MGGIGKTTLATHIHNQLQEKPDIFPRVCWISVPQDFSVHALQDLIAEAFGLYLGNGKDLVNRAGELWTTLSVTKCIIGHMSKNGLPKDNQSGASFYGEAWDLFIDRLGCGVTLCPERKKTAVSIVKKCSGLPLGIMTTAASMRGVDDVSQWRDALREPANKKIRREDLIEYLIDEGIVKEMGSRQAQFDGGHTMLNQLENASLLEGSRDDENYRYVKMHDLIRDMAVKIMKESGGDMVQAGAQLTELPDERCWREELNYKLNLVADSFFQYLIGLKVLDLSDTNIEKLPDSIFHLTSLTALLLGWCAKLSYVPSWEKLDLSYTGLEDLPEGMKRLKDLSYLNHDYVKQPKHC
ncbi:PREDICTED: probable disease resistance protein At1g12280 [Populus euphratica]|uniref:Probable disease resistance protein At1g12280 n=1 Tax=Populus euphratica TaxID=75702 RepID=A0AAJ6Y023_POPEU|nr:PREDICTED: probable disease resistance protein At1g12280 [Populus euphratica]